MKIANKLEFKVLKGCLKQPYERRFILKSVSTESHAPKTSFIPFTLISLLFSHRFRSFP